MELYEDTPVAVTFVVLLPVMTSCAGFDWFENSECKQAHLVLKPGKHLYMDGKQHIGNVRANTKQAVTFPSACFILQNELGRGQVVVDERKKRILRESFSIRARMSGVCVV